jgi:hypothetical protein
MIRNGDMLFFNLQDAQLQAGYLGNISGGADVVALGQNSVQKLFRIFIIPALGNNFEPDSGIQKRPASGEIHFEVSRVHRRAFFIKGKGWQLNRYYRCACKKESRKLECRCAKILKASDESSFFSIVQPALFTAFWRRLSHCSAEWLDQVECYLHPFLIQINCSGYYLHPIWTRIIHLRTAYHILS